VSHSESKNELILEVPQSQVQVVQQHIIEQDKNWNDLENRQKETKYIYKKFL